MTNSRPIALLSLVGCLMTLGLGSQTTAQTTGLVEFSASGRLQKGLPLVDLAHELVVIGRDGWLHSIDPRDPEAQVRHLQEKFEVASVQELRSRLHVEFGRDFEVRSTPNFLVVQPRGRGDRWSRLFEQSHRSFLSYMSKRGVTVRAGRFPMVAIVFPDQTAMYAEFKKLKIDVSRVSGLYSGDSNRVMTHDGGRIESIAATVRHEAAHQSAFNSGIHSRVNDTPRWITEGVGQMFEPAAMTDPRGATRLADRINRDGLTFIQRTYTKRNDTRFGEATMELVSGDTMFASSKQVDEAYAVSWAMMFYLAERQPKAFAKLLNHTASRPPFREYKRTERVRDFERIVGTDTHDFSRRVSWFLRSL